MSLDPCPRCPHPPHEGYVCCFDAESLTLGCRCDARKCSVPYCGVPAGQHKRFTAENFNNDEFMQHIDVQVQRFMPVTVESIINLMKRAYDAGYDHGMESR